MHLLSSSGNTDFFLQFDLLWAPKNILVSNSLRNLFDEVFCFVLTIGLDNEVHVAFEFLVHFWIGHRLASCFVSQKGSSELALLLLAVLSLCLCLLTMLLITDWQQHHLRHWYV